MARDIKITDLVDQKAFNQLRQLEEEFSKLSDSFAKLAVQLSGGVKVKPKTFEELKNKATEYGGIMQKLVDTQNELAQVQEKYKTTLKTLQQQTDKNVKAILEEAKANRLNADAELKAQKAETERLRQQKLLNQESKKRRYTVEEGVKALNMETKSIRELKEQNRILTASRAEVDLTTKKGTDTINSFNRVIDRNNDLIKKNSDSLVRNKFDIGTYRESIKAAAAELAKGNVSLKNMGNLARSTGGYLKAGMGAGLAEVRVGVGSMIKGMVGAQAVIAGIQKLIGLFKSGIGSIIDFEAANSKLAAILGTTSKKIKELTADAQRLGATTKYTASQATGLQIELAKLGFSRKEILQSTEGILKFAQATGSELPEAAALAGAALRMFNADTKETDRYVSAMAVATTKSALSFSYLQTALPIVGPVAKAFNFQIEDTLALLGKLADAGFDASMAATATRNILLNLADGSGKLAKALGGPVRTLPELVAGLQRLKEKGVDLNTTLDLTDKRSVAAFNAFLTASDKIVPLREQITGVTGELNDMADEMANNVQGSMAGLSSAWEAFMLSFYESKGPMKDVLDFLAKGLREVANQLRSYSQLQDDADNAAVARAQKEMATSDILEKNRKNMSRLYKEKLNEGMSADEAALAAKEEYIAGLKSQFEYENTAYQIEINKREKLEKELADRGLITTLTSWKRTNNVIKEEIKTATLVAAGKRAIASVTESVIEDLNKIDLKQEQVSGKKTTQLTDEQKKALEKAEKERLKIRQAYQQSELDLMDEGLNKELAKIALDYNKRIAVIKGNGEEEIKTRENLAKKMQEAIDDRTVSFNIDKEKKDISNRLEAVKKGSEEELELRERLLLVERQEEMYNADKTGADVIAIEEKYNRKRQDLLEKYATEKNKKIQENYASEAIIVTQQMQYELDELADKYKEGLIQKEDYEREKAKITEKYAIQEAKAAIELAKTQLETANLSPEDRLALKKKIAEAEIALAEKVRDAEINATEQAAEESKKNLEKIQEKIQMVGEILNQFSEIGSAIFDRKIQQVEEEQDANEQEFQKEQDNIEKLAEKGAISTEEAEARKRAAEERTAKRNEELEKKRAELQKKQAIFDKANNVAQTIMSTSLALIKAWTIPDRAPFIIPMIIAQGALSLATIMAQPIPKYAKGTDSHPGGLAIVGDGGKEEMIVTPSGKSYVTPRVPILVDLPKDSIVMPDLSFINHHGFRSDLPALDYGARLKGESITVNVNNDFKELKAEMRSLNKGFAELVKANKKLAARADLDWMSRRV